MAFCTPRVLQNSTGMANFAFAMQLERHIEILLLDNDCVIVPGLGGFVTHHVEARYDEADGTFLPPLRTLGFNPQLRLNDSLLAQSYVEAYDISYPEAMRRIEAEVAQLRRQLADEGSYELNDIGTLSLNEDGNCLFEPCEAGILTPDLYGLGALALPTVGATAAEAKPLPHPTAEPKPNSVFQGQPADGQGAEKTAERTISIKVSWLRNAVAVAAAIVAFFLITPPIGQQPSATQQSAVFAQLMPQAQPEAKAEAKQVEAKAKQEAPKAKEEAHKAKDEATKTEAGPYCIVMASHVARANAEAYVEKLHAEGYDQAAVYVHNNIVRVVYGNYQNEAQAYNELRSVRGNRHFEQSWVYKRK